MRKMIIFANNFFRLVCWKIAIKNGVKINKFYGTDGGNSLGDMFNLAAVWFSGVKNL